MADFMTPQQRSNCMSRVRGGNTTPELTLRKRLWAGGFRYRLHLKLPGRPDIVLPKYKAVIFVHGCFWHHHKDCPKSKLPETRKEFWSDKIAENVKRDKRNIDALLKLGWRVMVVWECQIKNTTGVQTTLNQLSTWLDSNSQWSE